MENQNKVSLKDPEVLFLSTFGAGFSPYFPGTVGSFVILLPLYFLGQMNPPFFLFLPFLLPLCVVSTYIIHRVEKKYTLHDPKWIVMDEVVGMWITCLFLTDHTLTHYLLCFMWFRIFDILKPWPVSYFDRMRSAVGTMFDDVVAGLLAGGFYLLTFQVKELFS